MLLNIMSPEKWFSNFRVHHIFFWGGVLKHRFLTSRIYYSVFAKGSIICSSNQLAVTLILLVWGPYFGNSFRGQKLKFCAVYLGSLSRAMALSVLSIKGRKIQIVLLGPELSTGGDFGEDICASGSLSTGKQEPNLGASLQLAPIELWPVSWEPEPLLTHTAGGKWTTKQNISVYL